MDRSKSESGKKRGSGLDAFINNRWCHHGHITVKECSCNPDIELLAMGLTLLLPTELLFTFPHQLNW